MTNSKLSHVGYNLHDKVKELKFTLDSSLLEFTANTKSVHEAMLTAEIKISPNALFKRLIGQIMNTFELQSYAISLNTKFMREIRAKDPDQNTKVTTLPPSTTCWRIILTPLLHSALYICFQSSPKRPYYASRTTQRQEFEQGIGANFDFSCQHGLMN